MTVELNMDATISKTHYAELLTKFKRHDTDVGSAEYQVICLTFRIKALDLHYRANKKDYPVKRRLEVLVSKRKKLQAYLQKQKYARYGELITALELRK